MDMASLLSSGWGVFAVLAAGVAVIAGAISSYRTIHSAMHSHAQRVIESEQMEVRIMAAIDDLDKRLTARDQETDKCIEEIANKLDNLKDQISDIQELAAASANDRLNEAYVTYGVKKMPISLNSVNSLERLYGAYKGANGTRNHIPEDFIARLHNAPMEGVN